MTVRGPWRWVLAGLLSSACETDIVDPVLLHTPAVETHADTFATSASCRSCHPDAYDTWQATYHRTMTQRAGLIGHDLT